MKRVALIDTQIPSYVCLSLPSLPPSHDVHPSLLSLSSSLSLFPLSLPSLSSLSLLSRLPGLFVPVSRSYRFGGRGGECQQSACLAVRVFGG